MTILDDIAAYKREELLAAKLRISPIAIEEQARAQDAPRGFLAALKKARRENRIGLVAEIKKASPSRGLIRPDFNPPSLATAYARGGATCLSVLTDKPSFQGAPEYLMQARLATNLPVLRKDFMLDPYQVSEARAWGADCILVILAMVDDDIAKDLLSVARNWNLDALVEIHDEAELDRALKIGVEMIGINNRDLNTFATDLGVTLRLAPMIPQGILVVAESGLGTPEDMKRTSDAGVSSFLIGESLMRETDVALATAKLIGAKVTT
jgi:indole-3-glycerol phosphate synthase